MKTCGCDQELVAMVLICLRGGPSLQKISHASPDKPSPLQFPMNDADKSQLIRAAAGPGSEHG
jgi:hypothetical protein